MVMKLKLIFTIAVAIITINVLASTNDSIVVDTSKIKEYQDKRVVLSLGYQPAVKADYFGASIFIHSALGPVGIYSSMTGLRKEVVGTKTSSSQGDIGIVTDSLRNWHTLSFGISIQTANNFFIYGGYSTGSYSDWITTTYQHTQSNKTTTYTVAKEKKDSKGGFDFGAMYYAGTKDLRFGLQLGYNTAMQSIVAGIQMGVFIKKTP